MLAAAAIGWVILEMVFYAAWTRPTLAAWNKRCGASCSRAAKDVDGCAALYSRFLAFSRSQPCDEAFLRGYLSTWFRGADPSDIKRENMIEIFTYGWFYRTRCAQ
jgi:hypothetical protein